MQCSTELLTRPGSHTCRSGVAAVAMLAVERNTKVGLLTVELRVLEWPQRHHSKWLFVAVAAAGTTCDCGMHLLSRLLHVGHGWFAQELNLLMWKNL
jgi:hypothetical protein